jgi:hypothetical protein
LNSNTQGFSTANLVIFSITRLLFSIQESHSASFVILMSSELSVSGNQTAKSSTVWNGSTAALANHAIVLTASDENRLPTAFNTVTGAASVGLALNAGQTVQNALSDHLIFLIRSPTADGLFKFCVNNTQFCSASSNDIGDLPTACCITFHNLFIDLSTSPNLDLFCSLIRSCSA